VKSVVVIILAIFFCFLAYLEAVAQEITTSVTTQTSASTQSDDNTAVAGSDISQTIDYGLQIICESEGEVYRIDFKGGFECGGLELGYN